MWPWKICWRYKFILQIRAALLYWKYDLTILKVRTQLTCWVFLFLKTWLGQVLAFILNFLYSSWSQQWIGSFIYSQCFPMNFIFENLLFFKIFKQIPNNIQIQRELLFYWRRNHMPVGVFIHDSFLKIWVMLWWVRIKSRVFSTFIMHYCKLRDLSVNS